MISKPSAEANANFTLLGHQNCYSMHYIFLLLSFVLTFLAALRATVAFRNPNAWPAVKDDVIWGAIGALICLLLSAIISRARGTKKSG